MLFTDYILNGQGYGEMGSALAESRFDPGFMRPFRGADGGTYVTVNAGSKLNPTTNQLEPDYKAVPIAQLMNKGMFSPTWNAGSSLRKNEWQQLDTIVIQAARQRLRAWADLAGANTFGGFNGMNKMILEHETMSDPGSAVVDMDGLSDARNDSPKFQLEGLPLPITHAGFFFSARRLAISRNTGTPLDLVMAEAAGRRVAETVEQTLIGTLPGATYGTTADYGRTPTVYGYTNFPDRATKTNMTAPTGSNGSAVLTSCTRTTSTVLSWRTFPTTGMRIWTICSARANLRLVRCGSVCWKLTTLSTFVVSTTCLVLTRSCLSR